MVSAAGFSIFIAVMFWFATGIFGLAMALMVLLLSVRILAIARRKRIAGVVARWRAIFMGTVSARPPVAVARVDAFTVLNLWNDFYRVSVAGAGTALLDAVARENGFDDIAMHLVHKDAGSRLVALTTIGYLRLARALDHVVLHTKEELGDLSLAAYRALVLIDSAHIGAFARAITEHVEWRPRTVEQILKELGSHAVTMPLARAAENATDEQLPRVLRYFTLCEGSGIRPALVGILQRRSNADVLAAALRALAPIATPQDRPVVRKLLAHPKAFVRIASIAALREIITDGDREVLTNLLSDANSWVRYRAAQTLLHAFMHDGKNGVVDREITDRFARDALKAVLAERSIVTSRPVYGEQEALRMEQRATQRRPMDELRA